VQSFINWANQVLTAWNQGLKPTEQDISSWQEYMKSGRIYQGVQQGPKPFSFSNPFAPTKKNVDDLFVAEAGRKLDLVITSAQSMAREDAARQRERQMVEQQEARELAGRRASALSKLPRCESEEIADALKSATQESPAGQKMGLELLTTKDAKESGYDTDNKKRFCTATGFFNNGKHQINYTVEWIDEVKGTYYIGENITEDGTLGNVVPLGRSTVENDENMRRDFCSEFGGSYCQ
jgi:hypothetical protein